MANCIVGIYMIGSVGWCYRHRWVIFKHAAFTCFKEKNIPKQILRKTKNGICDLLDLNTPHQPNVYDVLSLQATNLIDFLHCSFLNLRHMICLYTETLVCVNDSFGSWNTHSKVVVNYRQTWIMFCSYFVPLMWWACWRSARLSANPCANVSMRPWPLSVCNWPSSRCQTMDRCQPTDCLLQHHRKHVAAVAAVAAESMPMPSVGSCQFCQRQWFGSISLAATTVAVAVGWLVPAVWSSAVWRRVIWSWRRMPLPISVSSCVHSIFSAVPNVWWHWSRAVWRLVALPAESKLALQLLSVLISAVSMPFQSVQFCPLVLAESFVHRLCWWSMAVAIVAFVALSVPLVAAVAVTAAAAAGRQQYLHQAYHFWTTN